MSKPKKLRNYGALKPDAQNWVDNVIMTEIFQIAFRQQSCDKSVYNYSSRSTVVAGGMHAACGTVREAPPVVFRFLPGLVLAMGVVAPQHLSRR